MIFNFCVSEPPCITEEVFVSMFYKVLSFILSCNCREKRQKNFLETIVCFLISFLCWSMEHWVISYNFLRQKRYLVWK